MGQAQLNFKILRFVKSLRNSSNGLWVVLVLSVNSVPANALTSAYDPVEEFVTRFYVEILDRQPDSAGLADWVRQLNDQTKAGSDIAVGFIFSQEFINRGFTDSQYVDVLYRAFFNRESDTYGKATWLNLLSWGSDRKSVLDGFAGSAEFANLATSFGIKANQTPVEKFVTRFYQQTLLREPDPVGFADWVTSLNNKTKSGRDVAKGFALSTEMVNRGLSNGEFVTILYKAFFNRDPDQGGFDSWVTLLSATTTREEVLDGFLGVREFIALANSFGIDALVATVGTVTFGAQQVITAAADGAYSVYATDLDGDGDQDVLSASSEDNKIAWYENLVIQ